MTSSKMYSYGFTILRFSITLMPGGMRGTTVFSFICLLANLTKTILHSFNTVAPWFPDIRISGHQSLKKHELPIQMLMPQYPG